MSIPPVTITCNEGCVVIPSLKGAALNTVCPLWNNITASEHLAAHNGAGAFYFLKIYKSASDQKDVDSIMEELKRALDLLARSWIFACGVGMNTTFRETLHLPEFEDNAVAVRTALRRLKGTVGVGGSAKFHFEVIAQYAQPPLATASAIAIAMHADPPLAKLLQYHHNAWVNYYRPGGRKASWFIDLYKVRDFFKRHYGDSNKAREKLNITRDDWRFIGKMLDVEHDYRHADATGVASEASKEDIEQLFQISRNTIISFLKLKGLSPWSAKP
jgi:hypothetical protein